jgi:hypothetical protein
MITQDVDVNIFLFQSYVLLFHPELSFKEQETPKYIADFYKDKDCEVETNVGPNGVKVTILLNW